jgi:tRNA dimethylallyltransferase
MRKSQKKENFFEVSKFVIDHPREKLYERINLRVDKMMEKGLLDEVKGLIGKSHLNALKTVGYTELFTFLNGNLTLEQAIDLIKQNSRRYAKRQLTWFRKHEDASWIPFDSIDMMTKNILNELNKN